MTDSTPPQDTPSENAVTEDAPSEQSQPQDVSALLTDLAKQQNLPLALFAAIASCVIGGLLWAVITVITEYQIGFMAVGVGFLVGYAVRTFGKGITPTFGYIGAIFALVGCLLGNLFTQVGFIGAEYDASYIDILLNMDMELMKTIYTETFSPIDLLFYGIAIFQGYKISFRQLDDEQLSTLGNA